jgi:hypothetical protein
MSRSYRHTPIIGHGSAESEKWDKQKAARRWRHAVREAIRRGRDVLPVPHEIMTPWGMVKDGKSWQGDWRPDRPWQLLAK